jgi:hypothetical protein
MTIGGMTRTWSGRGLVAAAAVVLGATGLAACGGSSSDEGSLGEAQSFVADSTAFTYESVLRSTYRMDPSDLADPSDEADTGVTVSVPDWSSEGPGSTTTDRTVSSGWWTPDGWQESSDGPFGHTESRVFGSTGYLRGGLGDSSGQWQVIDLPPTTHQDLLDGLEAMRDSAAEPGSDVLAAPGDGVDVAAAVYLQGSATGGPGMVSEPTGFLGAIQAIADPTIAGGEGGAVTMSAELTAPADVEEAWGAPLPPGEVTLTVDGDGAPTAFRLRVEEDGAAFDLEVRFSEWNVAKAVVRPGDDEIDRTPWIDEEAVAGVTGIQLVRPAAVPEGWELDAVTAVSADDTAEGCDQVELDWSPMVGTDGQPSNDYLTLYLLPVACATQSDSTPFSVGAYAPLPSREGPNSIEVLIGTTVVQIDSTLKGSELDQLIRSLEVTDVGSLSADMSLGSTMMLTS